MFRIAGLVLMALAAVRVAHAQWDIQTSNTTADLRGIHSVGNGVAWASGTNGTVLRTEDGGYVWQSCAIPPGAEKLDFRGVQAFDANTAIVMSSGNGDLSRLYKTTDGCHSWKLINTNTKPDGFWDALVFQHADFGYFSMPGFGVLFGDPVDDHFYIEVTMEIQNKERPRALGEAWFGYDPKPFPAAKGEGGFAASNSSLFVLGFNRFIIGTGGKSGPRVIIAPLLVSGSSMDQAQENAVPMAKGESAGVFSLFATDRQHIVAVGGDYLKPDEAFGTAAFTANGGKTWQASKTPPHGYRSSVDYDADSKTWITVGPNGTDVSTDDGKNWRALHPDPALHEPPDADRNWNAISLPFVVGPHGRIGKLSATALKR